MVRPTWLLVTLTSPRAAGRVRALSLPQRGRLRPGDVQYHAGCHWLARKGVWKVPQPMWSV